MAHCPPLRLFVGPAADRQAYGGFDGTPTEAQVLEVVQEIGDVCDDPGAVQIYLAEIVRVQRQGSYYRAPVAECLRPLVLALACSQEQVASSVLSSPTVDEVIRGMFGLMPRVTCFDQVLDLADVMKRMVVYGGSATGVAQIAMQAQPRLPCSIEPTLATLVLSRLNDDQKRLIGAEALASRGSLTLTAVAGALAPTGFTVPAATPPPPPSDANDGRAPGDRGRGAERGCAPGSGQRGHSQRGGPRLSGGPDSGGSSGRRTRQPCFRNFGMEGHEIGSCRE